MDEFSIGISCDIIIEQKGKILLGKRLGKIGTGSWALPGGKLKFWERAEDCAKRELLEEAGIEAKKIEFIGLVNDREASDNSHFIKLVYLVTEFKGVAQIKEPDKCGGWEWFDKENLPESFFIGHTKLIELYRSKQKIID